MVNDYRLYFLIWLATSATLLPLTFLLYIAIMHMRKERDRLMDGSRLVRWVLYFLIAGGLISNTLLNWIFYSVAYLELPFGVSLRGGKIKFRVETMSTGRIVRHKYESSGWRHKQSMWWCQHWLTPFHLTHCEN